MNIEGRFHCLLLLSFLSFSAWSQDMVNVILVNSKSHELIPFATIKVLNTKIGTYADEKGKCSFPLNKNDTVLISSIGFNDKTWVHDGDEIDTVFLEPFIKDLDSITIGRRKLVRKLTLGITGVKADLRWGSLGRGDEFAQLINIPVNGNEVYKINKVILAAEEFNPTKPVLLHIYSFNERTGLPGENLLQTKYLVTARNFKRKKITIDISSENLYIAEEKIFVSLEWLGKTSDSANVSGYATMVRMTTGLSDVFTYRKRLSMDWNPLKMSPYRQYDFKPWNTIFSIEVEQYK